MLIIFKLPNIADNKTLLTPFEVSKDIDILHITDNISDVINYFINNTDHWGKKNIDTRLLDNGSLVTGDFSIQKLIESNGIFFYGEKCVINMNYDNSNCKDTFDSYSDMYKLIKPYERDIKLSEII